MISAMIPNIYTYCLQYSNQTVVMVFSPWWQNKDWGYIYKWLNAWIFHPRSHHFTISLNQGWSTCPTSFSRTKQKSCTSCWKLSPNEINHPTIMAAAVIQLKINRFPICAVHNLFPHDSSSCGQHTSTSSLVPLLGNRCSLHSHVHFTLLKCSEIATRRSDFKGRYFTRFFTVDNIDISQTV